MKRCLLAGLVALSWLAAAVGPRAEAQFNYNLPQTNPYGTPAISPWMNMNRLGANPAQNYYGLVRPQVDTTKSLQQLQQQYTFGLQNLQANVEEANKMSNTGHAVQFFNFGSYFPMMAAGGGNGNGLGGNTQNYKRAGR